VILAVTGCPLSPWWWSPAVLALGVLAWMLLTASVVDAYLLRRAERREQG
jgi:hypothetical protein